MSETGDSDLRKTVLRRLLDLEESPEQLHPATDIGDPARRMAMAEAASAESDVELKELYAKAILAVLALSILAADLLFLLVAWRGYDWKAPADVINVFIGATVVQLIGLALVVTKYLFNDGR